METVNVDGVLLDIDGVLVVSWEAVPGAPEALERVRSSLPVRLLTNTTSKTAAEIGSALRGAGFTVDDRELLTAGVATGLYLSKHHPHQRCAVLNEGPPDDLGDVALVGLDEHPDVVMIGSAGPSFDWPTVNAAARAVAAGAALVAMHGTGAWQTTAGLCVDGGAYVAALERATGASATVVGKPAATMFETALGELALAPPRAVMVGDDLDNDVLAARRLGVNGVLVRTGKFRQAIVDQSSALPDAIIDSITDLPDLLELS
jgi:HAD superfamily hydrolase (TIGR01458 family)